MTWSRRFVPAIPLPDGSGELVTLSDARALILDLPPDAQQQPAWQIAVEMLLMAGERNGFELTARIGMMRALYPQQKPGRPAGARRKRAKKYGIIR